MPAERPDLPDRTACFFRLSLAQADEGGDRSFVSVAGKAPPSEVTDHSRFIIVTDRSRVNSQVNDNLNVSVFFSEKIGQEKHHSVMKIQSSETNAWHLGEMENPESVEKRGSGFLDLLFANFIVDANSNTIYAQFE